MNSQLFEKMSSLAYSGFSKNKSEKEGFVFFNPPPANSGTTLISLKNDKFGEYNTLRTKLSNDPKYDFSGNILLFNDENILISEQVKKDNEMLIASENNLIIASAIAGVTMLIVAGFIIVSKK